jgi:hypothetical protein
MKEQKKKIQRLKDKLTELKERIHIKKVDEVFPKIPSSVFLKLTETSSPRHAVQLVADVLKAV